MGRATKNAAIVDPGRTPKIFATGVAAVDHGDGYVQVTFVQDQLWGGDAVQEREIQGRLVLTPSALAALRAALLAPRAKPNEAVPLRPH